MFLTGQAEVHSVCRRLRKAFPYRANAQHTGTCTNVHTQSHIYINPATTLFVLTATGAEDTSEELRKFKKAKKRKTVVFIFKKFLFTHP